MFRNTLQTIANKLKSKRGAFVRTFSLFIYFKLAFETIGGCILERERVE